MKVLFLTAGAAGMYCGSCMHDNALARSLGQQGVDCLLQPIYTPLRTDETSVAGKRMFFGGIQIYLLQTWPWLRYIPKPLRRVLDWPPLIRLATKRASATDAAVLGDLAISMLRGADGNQRDEVKRLVAWLENDLRPDAIVLSNLLIGGWLPTLRERLPSTRIAVMLQGDDIFLDHLPERHRSEVIELCHSLSSHVDVFVTNSQFYAQKMSALIGLDISRIEVVPLTIDVRPFLAQEPQSIAQSDAVSTTPAPFRLGYLARIAPEKGLHRLVDAFIQLAKLPQNADLRLEVAGWLGEANLPYLRSIEHRIAEAGLADRFTYHGSPDLDGKVRFLRSLDLFCVPTEYEDPKGLFILEALAAGVCVAQPDHGAFGELLSQTGGGKTFSPASIDAMCHVLQELKDNSTLRHKLAHEGQQRVHQHHSIDAAAKIMTRLLDPKLAPPRLTTVAPNLADDRAR